MLPQFVTTILLKNKHTSGAAVLLFGMGFISIWFPDWVAAHKAQIDATAKLAVAYGLLMAGDAKQNPPPPISDPDQPSKSIDPNTVPKP